MIFTCKGDLKVFFWDQPRLEYEVGLDCQLVISGETFGKTGYGVGLQKNSLWTEKVTLVILDAIESGFIEMLDHKWILKEKGCETKNENFPTTLGLENMAGVFMLVGAGIIGSFGLIVIEIGYKRRKARRLRQVTSVKKAVTKWKLTVEVNPSIIIFCFLLPSTNSPFLQIPFASPKSSLIFLSPLQTLA